MLLHDNLFSTTIRRYCTYSYKNMILLSGFPHINVFELQLHMHNVVIDNIINMRNKNICLSRITTDLINKLPIISI